MAQAGTPRPARACLPGLLVLIALAAGLSTLAVVAVRGHAPATRQQQVQQIAAVLHCPICKDLSVADSPAPLAQQMRQEIAQKLSAGESASQIRAGFVAAYGESVLMSPPRQGVAGVAYYLPVAVLAVGLIVALTLLRRWRRPPGANPVAADDSPPVTAAQRRDLDQALARLREEEPG